MTAGSGPWPPELPPRGITGGLAAALLLGTAGCSGSPFGDQLSRSFSTPPPAPAQTAASPAAARPAQEPAAVTPPKPTPKPVRPPSPSPAPEPAPKPARPPAAASPAAPAPYRLTLQLPAADPAAPAEAVTQALRTAGLRFEVERIERVEKPAPGATPSAQPAPPPR